jgi:hypothetical protein
MSALRTAIAYGRSDLGLEKPRIGLGNCTCMMREMEAIST